MFEGPTLLAPFCRRTRQRWKAWESIAKKEVCPSAPQKRAAIPQAGNTQIPLKVSEEVHDECPYRQIQGTDRLITNENTGLDRKRSSDRDALPLSSQIFKTSARFSMLERRGYPINTGGQQ